MEFRSLCSPTLKPDVFAKSCFEDALKQANLLNDPNLMIEARGWLAQSQGKAGKHLEAAQLWDESAKDATKVHGPNSFQTAFYMTGAAEEYLLSNQKATAIPLLQSSLRICRTVGNADYVAKIESCLTRAGVKPL